MNPGPSAPLSLPFTSTPPGFDGTLTGGPTSYSGNFTGGDGQWTLGATLNGASASVTFRIDRTPPAVSVGLPIVPMRLSSLALTADPPGFGPAWKRDESVLVQVISSEPQGAPAVLQVSGIQRDGGSTPFASLGTPAPCCGVTGNCSCFLLDLSVPLFETFNGSLRVRGVATDLAGNTAVSADAPLPLTRWRWSLVSYQPADTPRPPAVDPAGRLVLGASGPSKVAGTIVSLGPEGSVSWRVDAGAVTSAVAIGAPDAGSFVYAPVQTSGGSGILTLRLDGGSWAGGCQAPVLAREIVGALNLERVSLASLAVEQATVWREAGGQGSLTAHRPADSTNPCVDGPLRNGTSGPEATIASSGWTLLAGFVGQVIAVDSSNFSPFATIVTGTGVGPRSVAPTASGLYGTGSTAVFSSNGANVTWSYPPTFNGTIGNVGHLAIGSGNVLFFGGSSPPAMIRIIGQSTAPTHTTPIVGSVLGAPIIGGDGGIVYAVTTAGRAYAFESSNLSVLWSHDFTTPGPVAFNVSPALDCGRRDGGVIGGPGTLYLPGTGNGMVYAVIVDSPGLDPNAPWPKFQRGARNTGSQLSPVLDVSCP